MSTSISVFRAPAGLTVSLAASTSSSRVQFNLTAPGGNEEPTARVYNSGTGAVFIRFGDVTATASATTDAPIAPGATEIFRVSGGTAEQYIAAITASGTATLYITPGHGA